MDLEEKIKVKGGDSVRIDVTEELESLDKVVSKTDIFKWINVDNRESVPNSLGGSVEMFVKVLPPIPESALDAYQSGLRALLMERTRKPVNLNVFRKSKRMFEHAVSIVFAYKENLPISYFDNNPEMVWPISDSINPFPTSSTELHELYASTLEIGQNNMRELICEYGVAHLRERFTQNTQTLAHIEYSEYFDSLVNLYDHNVVKAFSNVFDHTTTTIDATFNLIKLANKIHERLVSNTGPVNTILADIETHSSTQNMHGLYTSIYNLYFEILNIQSVMIKNITATNTPNQADRDILKSIGEFSRNIRSMIDSAHEDWQRYIFSLRSPDDISDYFIAFVKKISELIENAAISPIVMKKSIYGGSIKTKLTEAKTAMAKFILEINNVDAKDPATFETKELDNFISKIEELVNGANLLPDDLRESLDYDLHSLSYCLFGLGEVKKIVSEQLLILHTASGMYLNTIEGSVLGPKTLFDEYSDAIDALSRTFIFTDIDAALQEVEAKFYPFREEYINFGNEMGKLNYILHYSNLEALGHTIQILDSLKLQYRSRIFASKVAFLNAVSLHYSRKLKELLDSNVYEWNENVNMLPVSLDPLIMSLFSDLGVKNLSTNFALVLKSFLSMFRIHYKQFEAEQSGRFALQIGTPQFKILRVVVVYVFSDRKSFFMENKEKRIFRIPTSKPTRCKWTVWRNSRIDQKIVLDRLSSDLFGSAYKSGAPEIILLLDPNQIFSSWEEVRSKVNNETAFRSIFIHYNNLMHGDVLVFENTNVIQASGSGLYVGTNERDEDLFFYEVFYAPKVKTAPDLLNPAMSEAFKFFPHAYDYDRWAVLEIDHNVSLKHEFSLPPILKQNERFFDLESITTHDMLPPTYPVRENKDILAINVVPHSNAVVRPIPGTYLQSWQTRLNNMFSIPEIQIFRAFRAQQHQMDSEDATIGMLYGYYSPYPKFDAFDNNAKRIEEYIEFLNRPFVSRVLMDEYLSIEHSSLVNLDEEKRLKNRLIKRILVDDPSLTALDEYVIGCRRIGSYCLWPEAIFTNEPEFLVHEALYHLNRFFSLIVPNDVSFDFKTKHEAEHFSASVILDEAFPPKCRSSLLYKNSSSFSDSEFASICSEFALKIRHTTSAFVLLDIYRHPVPPSESDALQQVELLERGEDFDPASEFAVRTMPVPFENIEQLRKFVIRARTTTILRRCLPRIHPFVDRVFQLARLAPYYEFSLSRASYSIHRETFMSLYQHIVKYLQSPQQLARDNFLKQYPNFDLIATLAKLPFGDRSIDRLPYLITGSSASQQSSPIASSAPSIPSTPIPSISSSIAGIISQIETIITSAKAIDITKSASNLVTSIATPTDLASAITPIVTTGREFATFKAQYEAFSLEIEELKKGIKMFNKILSTPKIEPAFLASAKTSVTVFEKEKLDLKQSQTDALNSILAHFEAIAEERFHIIAGIPLLPILNISSTIPEINSYFEFIENAKKAFAAIIDKKWIIKKPVGPLFSATTRIFARDILDFIPGEIKKIALPISDELAKIEDSETIVTDFLNETNPSQFGAKYSPIKAILKEIDAYVANFKSLGIIDKNITGKMDPLITKFNKRKAEFKAMKTALEEVSEEYVKIAAVIGTTAPSISSANTFKEILDAIVSSSTQSNVLLESKPKIESIDATLDLQSKNLPYIVDVMNSIKTLPSFTTEIADLNEDFGEKIDTIVNEIKAEAAGVISIADYADAQKAQTAFDTFLLAKKAEIAEPLNIYNAIIAADTGNATLLASALAKINAINAEIEALEKQVVIIVDSKDPLKGQDYLDAIKIVDDENAKKISIEGKYNILNGKFSGVDKDDIAGLGSVYLEAKGLLDEIETVKSEIKITKDDVFGNAPYAGLSFTAGKIGELDAILTEIDVTKKKIETDITKNLALFITEKLESRSKDLKDETGAFVTAFNDVINSTQFVDDIEKLSTDSKKHAIEIEDFISEVNAIKTKFNVDYTSVIDIGTRNTEIDAILATMESSKTLINDEVVSKIGSKKEEYFEKELNRMNGEYKVIDTEFDDESGKATTPEEIKDVIAKFQPKIQELGDIKNRMLQLSQGLFNDVLNATFKPIFEKLIKDLDSSIKKINDYISIPILSPPSKEEIEISQYFNDTNDRITDLDSEFKSLEKDKSILKTLSKKEIFGIFLKSEKIRSEYINIEIEIKNRDFMKKIHPYDGTNFDLFRELFTDNILSNLNKFISDIENFTYIIEGIFLPSTDTTFTYDLIVLDVPVKSTSSTKPVATDLLTTQPLAKDFPLGNVNSEFWGVDNDFDYFPQRNQLLVGSYPTDNIAPYEVVVPVLPSYLQENPTAGGRRRIYVNIEDRTDPKKIISNWYLLTLDDNTFIWNARKVTHLDSKTYKIDTDVSSLSIKNTISKLQKNTPNEKVYVFVENGEGVAAHWAANFKNEENRQYIELLVTKHGDIIAQTEAEFNAIVAEMNETVDKLKNFVKIRKTAGFDDKTELEKSNKFLDENIRAYKLISEQISPIATSIAGKAITAEQFKLEKILSSVENIHILWKNAFEKRVAVFNDLRPEYKSFAHKSTTLTNIMRFVVNFNYENYLNSITELIAYDPNKESGITNVGDTCFANSAIQALNVMIKFTENFTKTNIKTLKDRKTDKKYVIPADKDIKHEKPYITTRKINITLAFIGVLNAIRAGTDAATVESTVYKVDAMRTFIRHSLIEYYEYYLVPQSEQFSNGMQQDSREFFYFIYNIVKSSFAHAGIKFEDPMQFESTQNTWPENDPKNIFSSQKIHNGLDVIVDPSIPQKLSELINGIINNVDDIYEKTEIVSHKSIFSDMLTGFENLPYLSIHLIGSDAVAIPIDAKNITIEDSLSLVKNDLTTSASKQVDFTKFIVVYKSGNPSSGHYKVVFNSKIYDDKKITKYEQADLVGFYPYLIIYKNNSLFPVVPVTASSTSLSPPASPPIPISSNLDLPSSSSILSAPTSTSSPIDLEYEQFSNSPDIYLSHISSPLDLDQFYPPSFSF